MEFRFTPEMYMEHFTTQQGVPIEQLRIAPTVILSWFPSTIQSLVAKTMAKPRKPFPISQVYHGMWQGREVTVALSPIGAPGTIAMMEELMACGAETFLGLGATGSLQEDSPIGSFIIADRALSEEGTSRHYMPGKREFSATKATTEALSEAAVAQGGEAHVGRLWTTDAIYRERVDRIEELRGNGVLGVDMETSAMYAFGECKSVNVANILVVSDELWHEWRPAFYHNDFQSARSNLEDIILNAALLV